uniref:Glyoxylate pathway regulator n=1 Tax=Anthurium amnicola TaxID=1678845 RepID=A0A1D1ZED7_9ARAE
MPETQIYIPEYVRPEKSRPQSTSAKKHVPKLGNPTPLGLSAFAMCVMMASLYNLGAFKVAQPTVLIAISLFSGGVVQFASGMWEFRVGNTFGGTGFSAFGGFWASYALILQEYIDKPIDQQFHRTVGIFCLVWLIFTFIFTLACIRTNMGVLSAFVFLTLSIAGEVIYHLTDGDTDFFIKLAGGTGLACSFSVWYCLAGVLLTPDLSPISLPLWDLSQKND